MRLLIYNLLTQTIIFLSVIRGKLFDCWLQRRDRTFPVLLEPFKEKLGAWRYQERWHCCDCDCTHLVEMGDDGNLKMVPLRPTGYKYGFRWLAERPSPFVDERSQTRLQK